MPQVKPEPPRKRYGFFEGTPLQGFKRGKGLKSDAKMYEFVLSFQKVKNQNHIEQETQQKNVPISLACLRNAIISQQIFKENLALVILLRSIF